MQRAIATDSSADLTSLEGIPGADAVAFGFAPLKINAGERSFVDDGTADIEDMVDYLASYDGRSGTACPSVGEWEAAFRDADEVFAITMTSTLSAGHDAAVMAKDSYEAAHPGRRVCVIDSLSTGPEMRLLIEKLAELSAQGASFDDVCAALRAYQGRTHLVFALQSLTNLANNGRVKPAVAKLAGFLGVRVTARASEAGDIEPIAKGRGERRALAAILDEMRSRGYDGGKVRVSHVLDAPLAERLAALIRAEYPDADVAAYPAGGLCSFYAERGGLLVGYEGA
ncbi:MAG: DegV family EDD domain-containing protein [Eggerthellaceae bacterium]|nr:DegV family EDD domain-containing protein [Eggerthellaceae bacterium]